MFCVRCGVQNPEGAAYCSRCGASMATADPARVSASPATTAGEADPGSSQAVPAYGELAAQGTTVPTTATQTVETPTVTATPELATIISTERIVLLSILTYGLYLLYWFYLTWKHYRDHTKKEAYPVWHALTLFVPVYGLFRTHGHVRSFKELGLGSGVRTSLSPGWAVVGVLVYSALSNASFRLGFSQEGSGAAIAGAFLDVLSIGIVIWLLVHVQGNLNTYWQSIKGVKVTSVRTGKGEIVLGVIGVLLWLITVAAIAGLV